MDVLNQVFQYTRLGITVYHKTRMFTCTCIRVCIEYFGMYFVLTVNTTMGVVSRLVQPVITLSSVGNKDKPIKLRR